MENKALPNVLHTDDQDKYWDAMKKDFGIFNINVSSFPTNEQALDSAISMHSGGNPYGAVLADYNTMSDMSGAQLLVQIAIKKEQDPTFIGDILAISSSTTRKNINYGIGDAALIQGLDLSTVKMHIFDKTEERQLAALFVSLRMHFPDETSLLNRNILFNWLGIELREDGEVKGDSGEVQERMFNLQRQLKREEITLKDIFNQISPRLTEGFEGRPSHKESR